MAKTGRNDPCPCGSGKKFKLCCLHKEEAAAREAAEARQAAAAERAKAFISGLGEQMEMADDELDEASNAVIDLIDAGKLDEAEAAARDLLVRFPEVYDGYDRLGMVAEARGDKKLAAAHYRKVIEFTQQHPGMTDPALVANYHRMIEELDPPGSSGT